MRPVLKAGFAAATACVAALVLCAIPPEGAAQPYPIRPIRVIVTTTPGGGPDILGRLIGQRLTDALGQQVVVDNRAGAAGSIGAEIAARTTPDGYTLMVATSQHAIVSALYGNLKWDLARDFSPISLLGTTPFILVVNPSVAATSVQELIALAKSKPGRLHYGSGGSGSPPHLATEILKSRTGIDLVHVPYKGISAAIIDTVAGQVQVTVVVVPAILPSVRTGKVRALAVTSSKRTPLVPELPTMSETVPGYEFIGWYSLVAPAGTPGQILSRLNSVVVSATKAPEMQERVTALGVEPLGTTQQELASFIRAQMEKMRQAVKTSGARPD